jgi:hypothetical protein
MKYKFSVFTLIYFSMVCTVKLQERFHSLSSCFCILELVDMCFEPKCLKHYGMYQHAKLAMKCTEMH